MLGETKNQFSLTRAALSEGRRLESNFYQLALCKGGAASMAR